MVPTTRRRLLVAGTAAALAGCTSQMLSSEETTTGSTPRETSRTTTAESTRETTTTETTTTGSGTEIPDSIVDVLAALPRSVDGTSPASLYVLGKTDSEAVPTGPVGVGGAGQYARQVGLNAGQVDRVAIGLYAEGTGIISVTGSFAADEPTVADGMPEDVSIHRADGRFVLAARSNDGAWTAGMRAATAALNGEAPDVLADGTIAGLVRPVGESTTVTVFPSFPPSVEGGFSLGVQEEAVPDSLEAVSLGTEVVAERTIELSIVGLFADESSVDRSALSALTEDLYRMDGASLSAIRKGRRLVLTGRKQFDPRPSPGASPDADFSVRYDGAAGDVVLTLRGEESVETANLTVYVDGETVPNVFGGATVDPGEEARVSAKPFVPVRVEWTDPDDEDVFDYLARDVAGPQDAFEASYDASADEVTITYTGSRPAPTDHLRVRTRGPDEESSGGDEQGRPLSEWTETLEPAESFVVSDVQYRETVMLLARYEWDNGAMSSSVMYYEASPPGEFYVSREGKNVEVLYASESSNPADQYRVTVGGEPADTQFADQYTTLSRGDRIQVSGEPGEMVVVEYVGAGQPVEMARERIRPPLSFELVRNGESYELTYTAETNWDASSLRIDVQGEPAPTQFADSYSTLSKGDSVSLDLSLEESVRVVWTAPEQPMDVFLGNVDPSGEFELRYENGSATLTYTGEGKWPADGFRISVGGSDVSTGFGGTYVTNGDSVTLSGSVGDAVEVRYVEGDSTVHMFEETIHPTLEFDFAYDESADEITITLTSDVSVTAGDLAVRVFAADSERSPDAWAAAYETVSKGDSITLSTPPSLEAVVVVHEEWDVHRVFEVGEDGDGRSSSGGSGTSSGSTSGSGDGA